MHRAFIAQSRVFKRIIRSICNLPLHTLLLVIYYTPHTVASYLSMPTWV